mmetsp:Transcript_37876/g.49763  ORF Transcript_37876/g.49763 Transcript_37876/m.49763 type:complete len:95 (+) Transcript_37876:838-1122(+)
MNLTLWTKENLLFNTDGSRMKHLRGEKPASKKRTPKVDEKLEQMTQLVDDLIKYMLRMRLFPYVAQTEKYNRLGIKVVTQFYVNEKGNTFSDTE